MHHAMHWPCGLLLGACSLVVEGVTTSGESTVIWIGQCESAGLNSQIICCDQMIEKLLEVRLQQ